MTFVPHGSSFALLYSSPELAFQILQAALELHQRGLPPLTGKTREDPELTWNGDHPRSRGCSAPSSGSMRRIPPSGRPGASARSTACARLATACTRLALAPMTRGFSVWELLENVANTRSNEVAYVEHIAPVVESVGALVGPRRATHPAPRGVRRGDDAGRRAGLHLHTGRRADAEPDEPRRARMTTSSCPRPFGPRMRTPDAVAVVGCDGSDRRGRRGQRAAGAAP